jgi:hypothetical protein
MDYTETKLNTTKKNMIEFKVDSDIVYAADIKGFSVVNKTEGTHFFIRYPEAAVWAVLVENPGTAKSVQMLQAILEMDGIKTRSFIDHCLRDWRDSKIIL